ncbi:hypothetical protein RHSIM_Rhsim09G0131300 [Rhododendron simsii]|uniref:Uncharacterized protein n=1 Tax=Rhododendron simsii TaxID=118357 RepID=A0A834GCG3_RHOSS|nr:hypothetical protein RHSIM_Rhsim09G0131300 [Rhododendron simsii]
MASLDPEIVENIEAERNKMEKQLASLTLAARNEMEKQLASLTLAAPNAHLREQLTPLSDKDEENFDPERNKMEKQLASHSSCSECTSPRAADSFNRQR